MADKHILRDGRNYAKSKKLFIMTCHDCGCLFTDDSPTMCERNISYDQQGEVYAELRSECPSCRAGQGNATRWIGGIGRWSLFIQTFEHIHNPTQETT